MNTHDELVSMHSIIGRLLGGFGVKIAGAVGVVWMAYEVFAALSQMAGPVTDSLGG
jgi:hypothetical protein